jgi:type IV pilus assembly protein PilV
LEALVSILIFMLGLIALLGVATQAVNHLGQSKYRNDASYLAGELLGEMWISPGTPTAFVASSIYTDWEGRVAATLPAGTVTNTVTGTQISLDIAWADKKDSSVTHHYQTTAQISKNN